MRPFTRCWLPLNYQAGMSGVTIRWMVLGMVGAASVATHASPCTAQIIHISDDGLMTVQDAPAIVSDDGMQVIVADPGFVEPESVASGQPARSVKTAYRSERTLDAMFSSAARETGVDLRLLRAVAWHESRFRHNAVSTSGAIGIMQLMPGTALTMGVNPHDLGQNIRGGAWLLARLLSQYRGDLDLTLAAYNAGASAVRRHGGVPPSKATHDYITRIKRSISPSR